MSRRGIFRSISTAVTGALAAGTIDGVPDARASAQTPGKLPFSALSAPLLGLGWLLERGGDNVAGRLLLTGGAAGLAGNLYLECHCPVQSPDHMMLGHVTVILAMLLAGLLLTLLEQGRKSVD